jgi:monoamine oxidase
VRTVDVAVVGAGLAGLTAARRLAAGGVSVLVVEARDRVGGRVVGHTLGGTVVEMGGQWVGPRQSEILALIDELDLETFPTYDRGDALTVLDGTITRYHDDSLGLPVSALPEIGRVQAELEGLAATVPLSAPWLAPDADVLDRRTFEDWLAATTTDPLALRFFRFVALGMFTAESWDLSLLHALFELHSNGMIDNMFATTGGNQEQRVVGGAQRICERLVEELRPDAVRLGAPVHALTQDGKGVTVHHAGGRLAARHVIVTLPPMLAGRLRYDPALPASRDALTQRMPMGSVIKAQAAYATPFWRDDGLNGESFNLDEPVAATYDNSPPDGACGVLLAFIAADHAVRANRQPRERRRKAVLEALARLFGPSAAEPLDYAEKDWTEEQFTRGCYGGRLGVGAWTRYGRALTEAVGRIHWAGSETADVSSGYMDGAVRSGRRAAEEVLAALR